MTTAPDPGRTLYRTIICDPPWTIAARMGSGGRRKRSTVVPYQFMSLERIMALPVAVLADDQAHGGMGGVLGNGHEPILLASRGGLSWPKNELPASVVFWKQPYGRGKIHSAKPDGLHDLAERMSPGPRLEMFARRQRLGWDTWGNEALEHVQIGAA